MKTSIYAYDDYKKYLTDLGESRPRGYRRELAERAQCQTGYVTQVLSGSAHFSLDQAFKIAEFLGLDDEASDYLLLIVNFARSGSVGLRRSLQRKIKKARESKLDLKRNISSSQRPKEQVGQSGLELQEYYSSWLYSAVHVLVSSSRFQSRDALLRVLQISPSQLNRILEYLNKINLIKESQGKFSMTEVALHLGQESPLVVQHHNNWRVRAMQSIALRNSGNLHFSSVFTLSEADAEEIRENLVGQISRSVKRAQQSPSELAYAMNLDYFRLQE